MPTLDQIIARFEVFSANLTTDQLVMMGGIGISMILLSLVAMVFSGKRSKRPVDHAATNVKPKAKRANRNDQFFDRLDKLASPQS